MSPQAMQAFYPYPSLQQQQVLASQAQATQSNIVKVNGPDSALQYPVAPGTQSQPLFDNAGGIFYIVTADGAGSKTIEAFDYTPHVEPQPQQPAELYVTRSEYTDLLARFQQLQEEVTNGVHGSVQAESPAATEVGATGSDGGTGSQVQQHQTGSQQ
jgi:hypothetical protein